MVTQNDVIRVVADATGVDEGRIVAKTRVADVVLARFAAAYLMRHYCPTGCTFQSIGAALGGRNHATVIHAVASAEDAVAYPAFDPPLAAVVAASEELLLKKFGDAAKKMAWPVDNR